MGLGFVLAGVMLAGGPCVLALDSALDASQYAHTAWKVRDGFAKGMIDSIAQTPDGYLWLGTEFGLYRFDGERAVPWQPPAGQQLPSSFIVALLVTRNGTLWIGTLKGLASWKDGKLTDYSEVAGQQVGPLFQDREQRIWMGANGSGRLCAVEAGKVQCYGDGSFGSTVYGIYEDHKGNLWVAAEKGVWRWKPDPPETYALPRAAAKAYGLTEEDTGTLLVATSDGLKQLAGGKIQNYALPGVSGQLRAAGLFRSSDGSLWIGSPQGLWHLHEGKTDTFGAADGLSGDVVYSIFEDREGTVWVGTSGGLDRFREFSVGRISRSQGLSNDSTYSIQVTKDGAIWIATPDGLNRWENGRVAVYGKGSAMGQNGTRGWQQLNVSRAATEIANSGLAGPFSALGLDDRGRMIVSAADGMFYFDGNQFVRVPNAPGGNIWSIAGDGHGKLWMSHGTAGLFYFTPGEMIQPIPWSRLGHKGYGARALLPDRLQGGVWLGFYEGGIAYFKDGQVRASYTAADGLGKGRVTRMRFGSRGTLWAATEGGLSRIRDGRIMTLTSKNGLPCDEVHWSEEDDDHFVWVFQPCGLERIARSELDAWVNDPSRKIQLASFDSSDGVPSVVVYGSIGPLVTKAPDGKIWFVHPGGVSVIHPRHLSYNKLPPPVDVEQVIADRKTYYDSGSAPKADVNSRLGLPALIRDLQIDYTALSLVVPEKVMFRYKLEGFDKDWHEAGNRRQAFYSNLPPRNYRFRVAACNNSGVWNEAGTFLDFSIAPAYYQTNWFRALCVAAFVALLWALYELRLRGIRREFNVGLEERLKERTRIARELHDTLLQNLHGLLFRFQAARNMLPRRPEEAMEALDGAISRTEQAITESQDAITDLRPGSATESDLEEIVRAAGKELETVASRNGAPPSFSVIVEGERSTLHPILQAEVCRIAHELLRNAFRHACPRRVEAEVRYGDDQLRVRIRDDGKGMDPEVLKKGKGPGHWGILGAKERAKQIGAQLDFWSEPGAGTEVQLIVPAAIAYKNSHDRPRVRFLRRVKVDD